MKTTSKIKNKFARISTLGAMTYFSLLNIANAQSAPFGSTFVPSAIQDKSLTEQLILIALLVIMIALVAVFGGGIITAVSHAFHSIEDARKTGEWGPAFRAIGVIVLIVVFTAALAGIFWTIATSVTFSPSATISL